MARVYREARRKQIPTEEATRLVYMLDRIAKAYELGVMEQRLKQLEMDHGIDS